ARRGSSLFTVETHVCYLRELAIRDQVTVDTQVLGEDEKRLHLFQTMRLVDTDTVPATCEVMAMHLDLVTRRSAPFPGDVRERIMRFAEATRHLPRPERAGRKISLAPRRSEGSARV